MMFNLNNYNVVSCFNRKSVNRGGSMIIARNNIKVKERADIVRLSIECCIELSCIELENYILICVYRPPNSDYNVFEGVMEDILKKVFNSIKKIIVCGDFNVDILCNTPTCTKIISLFQSFDLCHVFHEPTRVTATSATCLDNVFCNCEYTEKFIINKLPSDHCGQVVKFSSQINKVNNNKKSKRQINVYNINKYKSAIKNKLDLLLQSSNNPDYLYTKLINILSGEYEQFFKKKEVHVKSKFTEWATVGILKSRNILFDLYDQKKYRFDDKFTTYVKNYSKIFKKVCIMAKSNYFNKQIKQSSDKIKTIWSIINKETGRSKIACNQFTLNYDNKLITTTKDVVNIFEDFFANIPIDITSSLDSSQSRAKKLLETNIGCCSLRFKFSHVSPFHIIKIFKQLNLKNTEDLWGMSVKVVSSFIDIVAPYLATIFNKCIDNGVFPHLMKFSKLIPLFKSGDKFEPGNYRPISILPVLSKVFEKIMLNQMLHHFRVNGLLHSQQYGFTAGKSTTDAGVALMTHIFESWERSQDALGVFCDLSKAFDCVDHKTLLYKLEHYGIRDNDLKLMRTYLEDRVQTVDIDGVKSKGANIKMGVPQGSILGPFLFLIYINDLPFMVEKIADIVLFADDTSLVFKIGRQSNQLDDVNCAMSAILNWFTCNNLLLNSSKTKCIKFTLPNVRLINTQLLLNDEIVNFVNDTVFLGITVDSKLQWGPHISKLASRLSSAAYAIRRIRQLTDVATAKLVYFSYFHSIMSYGILLWGKAADINTIFVLQKRAIRSIYGMGSRESLRQCFKDSNILTVTSQYIYENIMYTRKNLASFKKLKDCTSRNLRNINKLILPKCRLHKISNSFYGNCIRFYNKLPESALNLTERQFKSYIKQFLCKKAYYRIDEFIDDNISSK